MLVEVSDLNRLRLEENLTYVELARRVGLTLPTLYRVLSRPNAHVHDRTLYRIRKFLARAQRRSA